jgi:beta-glucosidase
VHRDPAGLVADGLVGEERLDVSARRLLREKFVLGLFENPFVDAEAADRIVGSAVPRCRRRGPARVDHGVAVVSGAAVRAWREAVRRGHRCRGGGRVR